MNYYSISHLIGSTDAVELITSMTGKSREWLMLNRDTELPEQIIAAANRIASGTPLQYITGKAFFFGDRYFITPDVLIPQPDTEHIVEIALSHTTSGKSLLDLCTGSGCIAISILKRAIIRATAVDISAAALDVARKNAELHKVNDRLTLICKDVLNDDISALIASADIITANPPYINTDVISNLPIEVRNEPHIALNGGADGMDFYRRFFDLSKYMKQSTVMILEIGYDQASRINSLAEKHGFNSEIKRDFGGNDRVAVITKQL